MDALVVVSLMLIAVVIAGSIVLFQRIDRRAAARDHALLAAVGELRGVVSAGAAPCPLLSPRPAVATTRADENARRSFTRAAPQAHGESGEHVPARGDTQVLRIPPELLGRSLDDCEADERPEGLWPAAQPSDEETPPA